ncbi:MAG: glutathione peroxidase [Burkholderiaceae bacterium]|nr:glutathione peroxidase [Burkholderiaceae bacterium]
MTSIFDFSAKRLQSGQLESLLEYKGQVILVVNTASKCGYTPQYAGLQDLFDKYQTRGFVILGFPCDQFGRQEPGEAEEITQFCEINYGVRFPMFEKTQVNGEKAHPLFHYLKSAAPGLLGSQAIKWNFTKFLVDKTGRVIKRYAPATAPKDLEQDIEALL